MMKVVFLIISWLIFLLPTSAISGSYSVDFILEQVKQKKLPAICAYMGVLHVGRLSKGKALRKKYGPDWDHMHHYSWALVDIQKGLYNEAVGNLNYVLNNIGKESKFRPMVLFEKASALTSSKKFIEAISVYVELVKIKPESERGWLGMANIFLLQGDKDSAKLIAEKGLIHLPDSKNLKAILK